MTNQILVTALLLLPLLSTPSALYAQAATPKLSFEVASVKQNKSERTSWDSRTDLPGRLEMTNVTLRELIRFCYDNLEIDEIEASDGPKWIDQERFDIQAKAGGEPNRPTLILMLRSLLTERFALQTHVETRQDRPIFALVVARKDGKLPSQIAEVTPGSAEAAQSQKQCEKARVASLSDGFCWPPMRVASLVSMLSNNPIIGRKVVDRTNLTGTYAFNVLYPHDPDPSNGGAAFVRAIQEQLGLRLESTRGPVQVLVIDHVEPPTPD